MKQDTDDFYSLQDVVKQARQFVAYLRRKWWLAFLFLIVGAGLGLLYARVQSAKYKAICTFILEEKSSGGGLSGLASQFGLNIGNLGSGGSIFAGDNILEIFRSKKVVKKVLLSSTEENSASAKSLAELYLDFSGMRKSWANKPALATISLHPNQNQLTPLQDSVLNLVYETIVKRNLQTDRVSKQGTIIRVQITAAHPGFARLMTERLVDEASKLYLDIRVGTAQSNIRQLQKRSDSLLLLLNNRSYRAAASQVLDLNPGIKTAVVPGEIANRDKTVLATLYAEVTKNLEASKLILSQQTPVIQLLDQPSYLLDDNKKGLLFLLVVGSFAGLCCFFIVGLSGYFLSQLKQRSASLEPSSVKISITDQKPAGIGKLMP